MREKRKELRVREVEFSHITSSALPLFFRQPLKSTLLKWLPSSFLWALWSGWLARLTVSLGGAGGPLPFLFGPLGSS